MMEIKQTNVMRGPNYWSNYRQCLIVMKLDLKELENYPTNKIPGFYERILSLLPSLYEHCCSEGCKGGFFTRVQEGTWMGHVVEHIALEIQSLAGMECGYGRTRSTKVPGVYNVIFSYQLEDAGLYAAEAAVRIAESLITGDAYDLEADLSVLRSIHRKQALGPSTAAIVDEALKRGIPYKRLDNGSLIVFGQGANQRTIRATMTSNTSSLGVDIAGDKDETKKLLSRAFMSIKASERSK